MKMIVIKIGGSVVDDLHESAIPDMKKISSEQGLVIVHGGGKEVTRVCTQLGKEPAFVTSPGNIKSRYTDIETAEIFTMVMSGRINKSIVRMLQKNGINAVGLSGVDGGLIRADRKKRLVIINEKGRKQAIDGGYTGKIRDVNNRLLHVLIDRGIVPVVSPIALSEEYDFLNVDGDRAAAYVAAGMKADTVMFVTNVDGLMINDKLARSVSLEEAVRIRPTIGPGMEKKVLAATEAIQMGVTTALIASGRRENPISSALSEDNCTVIKR